MKKEDNSFNVCTTYVRLGGIGRVPPQTKILSTPVIGVNISERKSGTEGTKQRELVFSPPPGGATGTVIYHLDATRGFCSSYVNPGYLYTGPYAARTKSKLAKHTPLCIAN